MTNIDAISKVYQEKFVIFCLCGLCEVIEQYLDQNWPVFSSSLWDRPIDLRPLILYTSICLFNMMKMPYVFFQSAKKVRDAMFLIRKEPLLNDSLFPFAHSTLDYLIMRPMIPLLTTISQRYITFALIWKVRRHIRSVT